MKRIAVALATPLLLIGLAGCGGGELSDDEQAAADSLADTLNQGNTDEAKAFGDCAGERIVTEVGLGTLKEDGLINDDNEVETPDQEQKVSEKTATGMATAILECNDWDAQGSTIKEDENLEATDEQVDEFVDCMKAIEEEDYRQFLIRQFSNNEHGDEAAAEKANEAVTECQQSLTAG
jgi:hypothetical protein